MRLWETEKTDKNMKIEQFREMQKKMERMELDNRYNIDQRGIDSLNTGRVRKNNFSLCSKERCY